MAFPLHRMRRLRRTPATAPHGPPDTLETRRPGLADVRSAGPRASASLLPACPARTRSRSMCSWSSASRRPRSAFPPSCCSASPTRRTPSAAVPGTTRASSSRPSGPSRRALPGPGRHHRRLLLRVHRSRPLRRHSRAPAAIDFEVDNDATVANLVKQAVSHAQAGADIIAPRT